MILRQAWKGFLNLSKAPSTSNMNSKSYRTGFVRASWAVSAMFLYFLAHYMLLSGSEEGSENNNDIYLLLIGAMIAGGIGAILAPRFNAFMYQYTPQGRRNARAKIQLTSKKVTSGSSTSKTSRSGHRSSSKSSSTSRSKSTTD